MGRASSPERCNRFGRYRIDKLIEKYGPDITLPDLRHELAQCERRHNMSDPCQVGYVLFLCLNST